jgi:serine/threonine-protein kinase
MAPEQVEGKPADARTDLWALGAILYEMVTGKRAFEGTSVVSLMAAIMDQQPPPITTLRPLTPPALDRMVGKCLAKDPESRWQTASDAGDELRWLASQPVTASSGAGHGTKHAWKIAAAVVLTIVLPLAAFLLGAWLFRSPRGLLSVSPQRLMIALPEMDSGGEVSVSPDGQLIAFAAREGIGAPQLYVRRLDEWHARVVTTMRGRHPCFSPDSQWLAFVASEDRGTTAWKAPVGGGAPQRIPGTRGGQQIKWLADGRILLSRDAQGIWIVNTVTGAAERLVGPKETGRGGRYLWPEMLPGNGAVLFSIWSQGRASLFAFSLRDRTLVRVLESGIRARYVAAAGHILYQSGRQLFAVPFDPETLRIAGESRLVANEAGNGHTADQEFDVSPAGVLVYLPPSDSVLVWKDRVGKATQLPFKARRYWWLDLSPDGRHAVLHAQEGTANRLYSADLERGEPLTPLTSGDDDWYGLFSRDGSKVLFTTAQGSNYNVAAISADRGVEPVTKFPGWQMATSFWPLGPVLLFNGVTPETGARRVMEVRFDLPSAEPRTVVATEDAVNAAFSPDGRFIAYEQTTDERQEVYVQAYPGGRRTRVSIDGGRTPVWNPRGGELFFRSPKGVMAARVENGSPIAAPTLLFEQGPMREERTWDVSPDGSRFLLAQAPRGLTVHVVTNWFEELKAKAPPAR